MLFIDSVADLASAQLSSSLARLPYRTGRWMLTLDGADLARLAALPSDPLHRHVTLSTMAWHRRTVLDALKAQGFAMLETTDKNHLDRLRSSARRNGLRLSKSRRSIGLDNFGGLMLIDNRSNAVVAGSRYDLDIEDAADWIDAAGDWVTE